MTDLHNDEKVRGLIDAVESELVYDPNKFECARTVTLAVALKVAALIQSQERERRAKIAESIPGQWGLPSGIAHECAAAIRAQE